MTNLTDARENPLGWYATPNGDTFPATNNPLFDRLRMYGYTTDDGGRTWTLDNPNRRSAT